MADVLMLWGARQPRTAPDLLLPCRTEPASFWPSRWSWPAKKAKRGVTIRSAPSRSTSSTTAS